jgi:hypothetical protein
LRSDIPLAASPGSLIASLYRWRLFSVWRKAFALGFFVHGAYL